jgi:choline dehydrogenase-like flavoprotein
MGHPCWLFLQLTGWFVLIDARTVPANKVIESDVCIVGAGAAGITLAREFIDQPFRVCLLESGGLEMDQSTQALYRGENIGLSYFPLEAARLRYFGGSTNHWEGLCRPLDAIDFEARDWVPYSGWPFGKSRLDPFYKRAQLICGLGPYVYDVKDWEVKDVLRLPFVSDRVITTIFQLSPPIRFGQGYRDEVVSARNISTYLYANVIDIETTETAQRVTRLQMACLQGSKFWVTAKLYILAAGGIENARLLLASNTIQSAGLGNHHDLVGRFFMEHPHLESGLLLPSDPSISVTLYTGRRVNNVPVAGILSIAPETLRQEKLLNFSAGLKHRSLPETSDGVSSLKFVIAALRRGNMPDDFLRHLWNVIADIDDVATVAYWKWAKKRGRRLLSLYNRTEQAPNPNSRIILSNERDVLGQNRVRLNWQLSAIDKRSIRRAHEIIGQELGRAGLGRFKVMLDDDDGTWPPLLTGGSHHMGTTRMHVDPKKGVVNENSQVHGVSNLFIAGSSVFPTCGYANPTLTIVALAVMLADHVKRVMK